MVILTIRFLGCDVAFGGHNIVTGDDGGKLRLYPFPCPELYAKGARYDGHSADVTQVRFTPGDSHVVSIGGEDSCIMVWKCITEKASEESQL